MTLTRELRTRELVLDRPVANAHHRWQRRQSVLLTVSDDAGNRSQGEATPLPGYGPDTFESAHAALAAFPPQKISHAVFMPDDASAVEELDLPSPSARFALACAVLGLRAQRSGRHLRDLLRALARAQGLHVHERLLPKPAHLLELDENEAAQLDEGRQAGAATFKAKLGREPSDERRALIRVQHQLHTAERLRFDANGAFRTPGELAPFLAFEPEFIEEPLTELPEPQELGLPLALDESLWRRPALAERWLQSGLVSAIVLKPMTLGLDGTLQWAARAERAGCQIVLSHCFDGSVAAGCYETLAQVIGTPGVAMGLGNHPARALWRDE